MKIKKIITNGFLNLKFENLPDISTDAQGLLTRMVNLPECDYVTLETLHKLLPADNMRTLKQALNELVQKNYVIKTEGSIYAVNKVNMMQTMYFYDPNTEIANI